MIAEVLKAAYILANVLSPLLGLALLPSKRTRRSALFLLLLPGAAVGGALFGFWFLTRILHGRVSRQAEAELSFYLGWVFFYILGLVLVLGLLLLRKQHRPSPLVRSVAAGIVASFITLTCLAVLALAWRAMASHYQAVGWDPVPALRATPAWRVVPTMLIVFAIFFFWSVRRLRTAPP